MVGLFFWCFGLLVSAFVCIAIDSSGDTKPYTIDGDIASNLIPFLTKELLILAG
jgi:hypothetical protein